jgi:hypothetical protein
VEFGGNYLPYPQTLDGRTLNNHATAAFDSGGVSFVNGATFNNLAGATFLDRATTFGHGFGNGSGAGAFNNAGAYVKSGAYGSSVGIPFLNSGSVDVQQGSLGLNNAANSGTVTVENGATLGVGAYTQAAGATVLNAGTINGGYLSINGGFLSGTGNINASVTNGGQVIPGGTGAAGTLAINGNYTQTATGSLNIELGGTIPGSQYDQLNVNGSAYLGGTLNLRILPNLGHVCGGTFAIVNGSPVSGTFATVNGLSQPGGLTLSPAYSSTSVTVMASKFASTTTVTASADPSILNQPVMFTATVSPPAGATDTPTGTVQFQVDSVNFGGPVAVNNAGQASFSSSSLPVGSHSITASYSGDGCFYASSSGLAQSVHYVFGGFLAPLNSTLAIGAGRTLPIKFQLTDYSGNYITALSAVTSLVVAGPSGTIALNGSLRYDPTSNQYVVNWQTKGLPVGTYTVSLALADGTTYTKTIQLTKSSSAAGLTTGANGGTGSAPGGLLGGDIALYVDNTNGDLTADELARIQDAVSVVDALVQPYGVAVAEVTDPTQADVTLNMDTVSAVGGYADGVLGCTTDAGQITVIAGWNFYGGSDPTHVGAGQYDFETVVMHELGHALGLGHSTNATSVMYATLGAGVSNRLMTTADLNVPDADTGGACGLHAAASPPVTRSAVIPAGPGASIAALGAGRAWMALDNLAAHDAALIHWPASRAGRATAKWLPAEAGAVTDRGLLGRAIAVSASDGLRRIALQARLVDSVLERLDRWSES